MTIQTNGDDCRESGAGQNSKQQFERWIRSKGLDIGNALLRVGPRKEMYYQTRIQEHWEAWQASRAAIEIELPPVCDVHSDDTDKGYDICHYRVQDKLQEQSIRFNIEGAERWKE